MNPVPMQCPLCAGTIQIDPAYAGQQVGCPLCQGVMVLPPPEFFGLPAGFHPGYSAEQQTGYPPQEYSPPGYPPQFPQAAPPNLPQLGCPFCGGAFQISPEMAGQQVACPHCQNAVTIPSDLFGSGHSAGFSPPPSAPPDFSQHSMQFIGLPPGAMPGAAPSQEIPTGYAASSSPAPSRWPTDYGAASPGVPVGKAVDPTPQQSAPAFEPPLPAQRPQPVQPPQPMPPQPTAKSERRGDAHLYPPGMTPKDAAPKPEKKDKPADRSAQPERAKDDRFPPGMERRESKESKSSQRNKPVIEREQRYPPGFKPPESPKQEAAPSPEKKAAEVAPTETSPAAEPVPRVDDLLPPGAAAASAPNPTVDSLLPPGAPPSHAVDALLPPGAAEAGSHTSTADEGVSRHSVVDALLPPGAPADPAAVPTEQVALPDAPAPAPRPIPTSGPGQMVLPTPDGDFVTVEKKEGVKTITDHGAEIEIRKLTPAERARRRRVKNIVMFTFAIVLLVVVILIMTRR